MSRRAVAFDLEPPGDVGESYANLHAVCVKLGGPQNTLAFLLVALQTTLKIRPVSCLSSSMWILVIKCKLPKAMSETYAWLGSSIRQLRFVNDVHQSGSHDNLFHWLSSVHDMIRPCLRRGYNYLAKPAGPVGF